MIQGVAPSFDTEMIKHVLPIFYQVSLLLLGYSVADSGVMYRRSVFSSLFLNTKDFFFLVLNIYLSHNR